jgi:hypothetical protein
MDHGGCCNCLVCKAGRFLGLIEECKDDCCNTSAPKKITKKKVAKKKTTKKKRK